MTATLRTSDTTTFGCTLEVEMSSTVRFGAALIETPRFRHQHHRRNLTGVAARLTATGDGDVGAVVYMSLGMFGTARQRRHCDAGFVGLIDDIARRRAECSQPEHALVELLDVRQRRDARAGMPFRDEVAVGLRDQLVDVDGAALGGHLGRDDDIDAVGLSVDVDTEKFRAFLAEQSDCDGGVETAVGVAKCEQRVP
jgi:hypothetical protein